MNEKLATQHLQQCGVEINLGDPRSAEEIVGDLIAKNIIPSLVEIGYDPTSMKVEDKINF